MNNGNEEQIWFDNLPKHENYSIEFISCDGCGESLCPNVTKDEYLPKWIDVHFAHRKKWFAIGEGDGSAPVYESVGTIERPKPPVLKIRFVLLEKAIVMEVLEKDLESLGWLPDKRDKFDGKRSEFISGVIVDFMFAFLGDGLKVYAKSEAEFEDLKSALTEFAAGNAFHGKDKPVPEIRAKILSFGENSDDLQVEFAGCKSFVLYRYDAESTAIFPDILRFHADLIKGNSGSGFVTYETFAEIWQVLHQNQDKPRFKSEWRRITPRECEMPETIQSALTIDSDAKLYKRGWRDAMQAVENAPEIWEFEMREI